MEFYEVMRTTFTCREFTGEPIPDGVLRRIIGYARFAPSGGYRQGWQIINISKLKRKSVEAILRNDTWSSNRQ